MAVNTPPPPQPTADQTGWALWLWPFLLLAGPMVASRLGLAGMSLADGWMVAQFSPLGAADLGTWTLVDNTVGRALDVAVAFILPGLALVAQAQSAQRPELATAVWRRALVLSVGAGLTAMALMPAMPWLLQFSPEGQRVAASAHAVAMALAWGFVPALLAMACGGYLEAMGRPLWPVLLVILANVANVLLNWVLIQGRAWPGISGAEGCAWATTAVRWGMALALGLLAWQLASEHPSSDRRASQRPQLERGLSAGGQSLLQQGISMMIPLLLAGASLNLWNLWAAVWLLVLPLGILAWGLADACSLRVAALCGRCTGEALRRMATRTMLAALALMLLATLPWWLWPDLLQSLVPSSASLTPSALRMLVGTAVVGMLLDGLSSVLSASLRALHVLRATFWIQLLGTLLQWGCLRAWVTTQPTQLQGALDIVCVTDALKLMALCALFWLRSPRAQAVL